MATISNTAGNSGSYGLGSINGPVTLFTTPAVADAIFMVYFIRYTSLASVNTTKIMLGPSTPCIWIDNTSYSAQSISWHWVQMVIS